MDSRLSEHCDLDTDAKITFYRNRDEELVRYFSEKEDFTFCNNIQGLLLARGLPKCNSVDWCLFIDSSE